MNFFLNELSLHGQFNSIQEFLQALSEIFRCRDEINKVGYRLYCTKSILTRPTLNNDSFQQTVMNSRNMNLKRSVMIWLSKLVLTKEGTVLFGMIHENTRRTTILNVMTKS